MLDFNEWSKKTPTWQNTGETNIDGGPNIMTLAEAKEAYAKGLPIT